jgi:DNA-binding HxlR family transcriptional regulator
MARRRHNRKTKKWTSNPGSWQTCCVKTYGQYCPIARGAEIFANRWTPVIVRNLLLGCETFSEIRAGAPGISRTLLSQRLRDLERWGVVERRVARNRRVTYALTEAGQELRDVCWSLGTWGARWLDVAPEHLDATVVLWSLCRTIDVAQVPEGRLVVRFDLADGRWRRLWVVAQKPEAELCARDPGFDDDVVVKTSSESLMQWHTGKISLGGAIHAGTMQVQGPRPAVRELASWGGRSAFAHVRPARSLPTAGARVP